jgi:hypothetical protein
MAGRYDNLKKILELDPKADCQQIAYLVGCYEYPWLLQKSLEFALFRTYAVPHTSRVLVAAGQFEKHGQKRYDDTTLMLSGLTEKGLDSEYARIVIGRMNELHGRWNLKNEDMLYVLSTFIFEPLRWSENFGWRKPTQHERLANFYFWSEIGKRMGIKNIPEKIDDYEAFNIAHEKKHFKYDDANRKIGLATIAVFLSWYPAFLRPLVHQVILSFMDDALLKAMNFQKPHPIVGWLSKNGLRLGGFILRFMPPRKKPFHYTELPTMTYGKTFKPEELGAKYES